VIDTVTSAASASTTPPATSLAVSSPEPISARTQLIRQEAQDKFGQMGQTIAEAFPAAVLNNVAGKAFKGAVNPVAFKAFLDSVLTAAGNPSDPIEIMLVQQLTWAHHHVGNLVSKAASATALQEVEVYNQALTRIMGESRRCSLALREYRSGASPKQITVVKQQNVAAGNQNVAMVDGTSDPNAENYHDSKLGSNHARLNHVESANSPFGTTDCRTPEPVEAKRHYGARP
jgi:hypothetical protein